MDYVEAKIVVSELALKEKDIESRKALIEDVVDSSAAPEEYKDSIRNNMKEGT